MNTAQVPLHLVAGSRLDVWTASTDAKNWFASALFEDATDAEELGDVLGSSNSIASRRWWESSFAQCSVGMLVKVNREDTGFGCNEHVPRITEILIYGARIPYQERSNLTLPSPPPSSPSRQAFHRHEEEISAKESHLSSNESFQLHALPLSSDLLHQAVESAIPPLSPHIPLPTENTNETTLTFLPSTFGQFRVETANENKRQRVTDLFDKASQRRLKARRVDSSDLISLKKHETLHRRGKKSISFCGRSQSSQDMLYDLKSQPPQQRSTSSSCSILMPVDVASRLSNEANPRRSSLSRAASISNIPTPARFEPKELVARNKDIISRVVMAGLRLNGPQPRKTRSRLRRQSTVGSEITADGQNPVQDDKADNTSDEPFKTMYHMVFKATVHTFVSQLNVLLVQRVKLINKL